MVNIMECEWGLYPGSNVAESRVALCEYQFADDFFGKSISVTGSMTDSGVSAIIKIVSWNLVRNIRSHV